MAFSVIIILIIIAIVFLISRGARRNRNNHHFDESELNATDPDRPVIIISPDGSGYIATNPHQPQPKPKKYLSKEDLELYPVETLEKCFESRKPPKLTNFNHNNEANLTGNHDPAIKLKDSDDNDREKTPDYPEDSAVLNIDNSNDELDCLICFETLQLKDKIRPIPCNHLFHQKCLDTWLLTRSSLCPTCRYELRSKQNVLDNVPHTAPPNMGQSSVHPQASYIITVARSMGPGGLQAPGVIQVTRIPNS